MSKILLAASLFFLCITSHAQNQSFFDADDQYPYIGLNRFLESYGLSKEFDADSLETLQEFATVLNESKEQRLMSYAQAIFATLKDKQLSITEAYQKTLRMIFALYTENSPGSKWQIRDFLKLLGNKRLKITKYRGDLLTPKEAQKEAVDLYYEGKKVVDYNNMHVDQLSNLDISPNHSWWYSQNKRNAISDIWQYNEDLAQKLISKKINASYHIQENRRFFLFDKIKSGGTSTKIAVKDLSGIEWSMKWGDEVQSETIVNRLYTASGAKFADLVYPIGSKKNQLAILILDKVDDKKTCTKIASFQVFLDCMKDSSYQAALTNYVHSHGVLTQADIDNNIMDLNHVQKNPSELIGRNYIIFKEGLVELKLFNQISESGSATFNTFASDDDRVLRSLSIFNAWVASADTKDENNRAYLFSDLSYGFGQFLEYQHDMGTSLGTSSLKLFPSKGINALKFDHSFVKNKKNSVLIKNFVYYKPTSWKETTFADARWMTNNILSISGQQLSSIIKQTNLPNFAVDLLQYRLEKRRQNLADAFDLVYNGKLPEIDDSLIIDLTTPKARLIAAKHFDLSLKVIEDIMQERGLLNSPYNDTYVKNYEIVANKKSVIIAALEREQFPSGLAKKLDRF